MLNSKNDLVLWLRDVGKDNASIVGGKAANLGEMIKAKFPVPDGFVIAARSYFEFIKHNDLEIKIKHLLGGINYEDEKSLENVSKIIKKYIIKAEIPSNITNEVFKFYKQLSGVFGSALVAVRSSATSEDSKLASFAGQQETYLNIRGEASLAEKIKEGWASLFEPRAIFYRHENKVSDLKIGISLAIQKMVESDVSGVIFTVDPVSSEKSKIVMEAIYGLGEYIVQGIVTPDTYEINKNDFSILSKSHSEQKVMLKKVGNLNKEVAVAKKLQNKYKLEDDEIIELAKLAKNIEDHYYFPQDIEWAKEKNKFYIVQTRPITTTKLQHSKLKIKKLNIYKKPTIKYKLLLMGDPASPGIASGPVKIIKNPREIGRIKNGDILVSLYTNPDFVPAMKKSAAIITEKGGRTSHAAIVSREFGIPAVTGVFSATSTLQDNKIVTVNGRTGEIFEGRIENIDSNYREVEPINFKLKTKVLVNLAIPERAYEVSRKNIDGVGLLRAEFMIAEIGIHPKKLIKDGREKFFIEKLALGLERIARAFYPRPVLYRATDLKSNEYKNLIGGKAFEPTEENPMLGFRGAFRYINDPKVFKLELSALRYVRDKKKLTNLNLMIPFVRTPKELSNVKKIINDFGLKRSQNFKLFMMAEIPSNVILIDEFLKVGIDGVSIGSNDLTMLTLGLDRDNSDVSVEFDERNEAVLWSFERIIKACRKMDVDVSICGQAPSCYPDLVKKLVAWGITSISVSEDAISDARRIIFESESKFK